MKSCPQIYCTAQRFFCSIIEIISKRAWSIFFWCLCWEALVSQKCRTAFARSTWYCVVDNLSIYAFFEIKVKIYAYVLKTTQRYTSLLAQQNGMRIFWGKELKIWLALLFQVIISSSKIHLEPGQSGGFDLPLPNHIATSNTVETSVKDHLLNLIASKTPLTPCAKSNQMRNCKKWQGYLKTVGFWANRDEHYYLANFDNFLKSCQNGARAWRASSSRVNWFGILKLVAAELSF